jgi:hypothetical protein
MEKRMAELEARVAQIETILGVTQPESVHLKEQRATLAEWCQKQPAQFTPQDAFEKAGAGFNLAETVAQFEQWVVAGKLKRSRLAMPDGVTLLYAWTPNL